MWKLVRDKIPEILSKKDGKDPEYVCIDGNPLKFLLKDKLLEEAEEVSKASSYEELKEEICDCLEVLHSLAEINVIDWTEVENTWMGKRGERGGFKHGILLKMNNK